MSGYQLPTGVVRQGIYYSMPDSNCPLTVTLIYRDRQDDNSGSARTGGGGARVEVPRLRTVERRG